MNCPKSYSSTFQLLGPVEWETLTAYFSHVRLVFISVPSLPCYVIVYFLNVLAVLVSHRDFFHYLNLSCVFVQMRSSACLYPAYSLALLNPYLNLVYVACRSPDSSLVFFFYHGYVYDFYVCLSLFDKALNCICIRFQTHYLTLFRST